MRICLLSCVPAMLCLNACGALRAQQPAFSGVIRGVLIECDDPGPAGAFSIRVRNTNQVYRFRFDAKTLPHSSVCGKSRMKHFQSDWAVKLRLLSVIDNAHPAPANFVE